MTGEQFSRTALMMEIETLQAELDQAKEIMAMHSETISQMAEQLKMHSGVFQDALTLSEADIRLFFDSLNDDLYFKLSQNDERLIGSALKQFFVYKLGTAYGQSHGETPRSDGDSSSPS